MSRLDFQLGQYEDRDEFQVDELIVWVTYAPTQDRATQLRRAEALFPLLESDIQKVEELTTQTVGSSVKATAIGLLIRPDGSASYQCTFFGGSHDDQFVDVERGTDGALSIVHH